MELLRFEERKRIRARALFVGERIDVRAFERVRWLATAPLAVEAGDHGYAVIFRYGAVVLFELSPAEELSFMASLGPLITGPFPEPESEEVELEIDASREERVDSTGVIGLRVATLDRLRVVADILAKSAVLSHYEGRLAEVLDHIEPLAASLSRRGRSGLRASDLLRQMGEVLLTQHTMVGRVEVTEKPELLWEHAELERVYARLEQEYELRERSVALERKLQLISRTAETLHDLLQSKRTLRVEWYIVILILAEILLTLYQMFRGLH